MAGSFGSEEVASANDDALDVTIGSVFVVLDGTSAIDEEEEEEASVEVRSASDNLYAQCCEYNNIKVVKRK